MDSGKPQIAVGAVVVDNGALLMVRRGHEPAKGLWTIPGGRLEKNELLEDAVVREVAEETGLQITVSELLGIFEVPGDPHYVILDYLATVTDPTAISAAGDADEARWVPLNAVKDLPCTPRFIETMASWGILGHEHA